MQTHSGWRKRVEVMRGGDAWVCGVGTNVLYVRGLTDVMKPRWARLREPFLEELESGNRDAPKCAMWRARARCFGRFWGRG